MTLPTVLVVDDDPISVTVIGQTLKDMAEVVFASDGIEAIARANDDAPDLILLDVLMPGADGYEVCARLKADPNTRDIPIVFVSTLTEEGQEARGLLAGAVDYVTKPVSPAILAARVRNHLAMKRQRDLLELASSRDEVTGLGNRRRLEDGLHSEWGRAARTQSPLTAIVVEIDAFPSFGELYGPLATQECLRRVALSVSTCARRPGDLVVRFMGDRCIALLPDTDERGALTIAERMRAAVASLDIPHARAREGRLTLSAGVAVARPTADARGANHASEFLARATRQLDEAKRAGGNRCLLEATESAAVGLVSPIEARPAVTGGSAGRLFIVDDDATSRETLADMARRGGYEVETSAGGARVVAELSAARPELILLDILMPEMDGFEVCRRLKATPETSVIPIIFLSRVEDGPNKVLAFEVGGADYVEKPFQPEEVFARIAHQLKLTRLQKEMREAHARLVDLDRLKAMFAAMLVHDLRSPLSTVQITLSMLEAELQKAGNAELLELVDLSLEGLKNTLSLISEMLEIYRTEHGEAAARHKPLDLAEIVESAAASARVEASRRGLSVELRLPRPLPLMILGDDTRLRRVFANLLGNALKFSHEGGHVAIDAKRVDDGVRAVITVEVRDTGAGIPEHEIPYIFDLYRQAESRQRGAGVGLGLAIVKRILDAHDASITVKSQLGVGTAFTLTFAARAE